jgi:hypothetical protein
MTVSTVSCSTSVVWQGFKDLLKALQFGNAAEVAQLLGMKPLKKLAYKTNL